MIKNRQFFIQNKFREDYAQYNNNKIKIKILFPLNINKKNNYINLNIYSYIIYFY